MRSILRKLSSQIKWITLFVIWILHGVIAFLQFQAITVHESSLPFFFLRALFIVWILFDFMLIASAYKDLVVWRKWKNILDRPATKDILLTVAASLLFLRICLWVFKELLTEPLSQTIGGYIGLLTPALDLMGYVSFEIVFLVFFVNLSRNLEHKGGAGKFLATALVVFFLLGGGAAIVSATGLGIVSGYKGDWQRGLPAVALLEWQILLVCVFCLAIFWAESKWKLNEIPRLELWICVAVWLAATLIWLSQPVIPSASALTPREPNFEIYPFIDSQVYDEFAQSILIGQGFGADRIPPRPLYVVFLATLHLLAGQDYHIMIFIQTLVFAMFPVLLYLFGREFFGRPVGVAVAFLAIFRDFTSNLVSPYTGNLSYSKVFLSEIPTAMLLILFLFIGMHWIRSDFSAFKGFLLGGVLGAAMLIRTQSVVVLPVIILFGLLAGKGKIKPFMKSMLFVLVSLTLVIGPWFWHNWKVTGELIFDSPEYQTINLALRYSRLNGLEPNVMPGPGESSVDYNQRLIKMAKDAMSANPSRAVWGVSNFFLNHAVNNILLFPLRNEIKNYTDLYVPTDAFWEKWEGQPTAHQSLLLVFYVFLFGLGVTTAIQRNGWLGLMPLALNLIYNLWTSLALLSGQRFMLSMDWSVYLYYMIGMFTLIGGFLFALNGKRAAVVDWVRSNPFLLTLPSADGNWRRYVAFGLLFFGIGSALPLSETVFPDKYPPLSGAVLARQLIDSSALRQADIDLTCFAHLNDAAVLSFTQGMAVYPRYYGAGEGEKITDKVGYKVVDEGRLVFDLIANRRSSRVIFPMTESPQFFPHASDVILVYGLDGELWFIYVKQQGREKFYMSGSWDPLLCLEK